MKAAYLAYGKSALQSLPILSNYFQHIDFYIIDSQQDLIPYDLNQVGLMVDHLMIPLIESKQTDVQKKYIKTLQNELTYFIQQLSPKQNKEVETYTETQKTASYKIEPIAKVKDIVFNSKTQEVLLEKEKIGIEAYQFVFVENHQLTTENLLGLSKNIYRTTQKNSHVWMSIDFEYELVKPREGFLEDKQFILVADKFNKSIIDNWYFISLKDQTLSVHLWVPYHQFKNSDFCQFIIERTEKIIKQKIELFQIKKYLKHDVNPASGYLMNQPKLKNSKIAGLMPSFHFWTKQKVNQFLYSKYDSRFKEMIQKRNLQVKELT